MQQVKAWLGRLEPMPPTMLVFAHPDDEVIAVGARLEWLREALFVHVTDGAPADEEDSRAHGFASLEAYREVRERELARAFALAGVAEAHRESLGYADQSAAHRLLGLTRDVFGLLVKHRPQMVMTHPYEGGHPDHEACAFAVRHAVDEATRCGVCAPAIVEACFYHQGPQGICTGEFLSSADAVEEIVFRLSAEESERERRLLECFATQQETLQYFRTDMERYRLAPQYDFARPPHDGPVFYDHFSWGITSARFCELAGAAEEMLQAEAACR